MNCGHDALLSLCSGHGECVNASSQQIELGFNTICVCDQGWSGAGDFVNREYHDCSMHNLTILIEHIVAAILAFIYWSTALRKTYDYMKFRSTQHKQNLSHGNNNNNAHRVKSQHGGCLSSFGYPTISDALHSFPFRVRTSRLCCSTLFLITALLWCSGYHIGSDIGISITFWISAVMFVVGALDAMYNFVKLNLSMIFMNNITTGFPAKLLKFTYAWSFLGPILVIPAYSMPFWMAIYPHQQDTLTIVFWVGLAFFASIGSTGLHLSVRTLCNYLMNDINIQLQQIASNNESKKGGDQRVARDVEMKRDILKRLTTVRNTFRIVPLIQVAIPLVFAIVPLLRYRVGYFLPLMLLQLCAIDISILRSQSSPSSSSSIVSPNNPNPPSSSPPAALNNPSPPTRNDSSPNGSSPPPAPVGAAVLIKPQSNPPPLSPNLLHSPQAWNNNNDPINNTSTQ